MRDLAEWRPAFPCGAGQTERAIEIPWALSRYNGGRRVLEVGCSFASENPEYSRGLIALNIPELHGIDISSVEAPHFLSAARSRNARLWARKYSGAAGVKHRRDVQPQKRKFSFETL